VTPDRAPHPESAGPRATNLRTAFVARVVAAFDEALMNYVVLSSDEQNVAYDSDLDIALDRPSLEVADTIIRSGRFGRLIQCLYQDVPWSRLYVLEVREPGRRYRQIDITCDPWGIGRYGKAIDLALSHRTRTAGGRPVPEPAAAAVHAVVKRARKGMRDRDDELTLLARIRSDPARVAELLDVYFDAGGDLLGDLASGAGADLSAELAPLNAQVRRQRRAWFALGRRGYFSARRIFARLARPTGLAVGLVGPDGVGKSSLAAELQHESSGAFRRSVRYHLSPGLLPPPARLLRRQPNEGALPHAKRPSGTVGSVLRIGYLWIDTLVGWWPRIWLPRTRTSLVVLERGWLDLAVDPRRYRLSVGTSLVWLLSRLLPRPDLVLSLDASADVIHGRKAELDVAEIDRQLDAWRSVSLRDSRRYERVDASLSQGVVVEEALRAVDDRLASRQLDLVTCRLALTCLGGPVRAGTRYTLVSVAGKPRWLLPAGGRACGPLAAKLYRPARTQHLVKAIALECLLRSTRGRFGRQVGVEPGQGVAPAIAEALGIGAVDLAATITGGGGRGQRTTLSIWDRQCLVAFAKVSERPQELEHERAVLDAFASCELEHLVVPRVLGFFVWNGFGVLLLERIPMRSYADRGIGPAERAALAELSRLSTSLSGVLGEQEGSIPVHGDFAPWNCEPTSAQRLVLWDWERTRLGLPLEDVFHWRTQRLVHFREGNTRQLVTSALESDPELDELCALLGVPSEIAAVSFRAYLERNLAEAASGGESNRAIEVWTDLLAQLDAARR
jgi:hypothetical protein